MILAILAQNMVNFFIFSFHNLYPLKYTYKYLYIHLIFTLQTDYHFPSEFSWKAPCVIVTIFK